MSEYTDPLAIEIKEKMDEFFKKLEEMPDEEFIQFMQDLNWEHYANLPDLPGFYEKGKFVRHEMSDL